MNIETHILKLRGAGDSTARKLLIVFAAFALPIWSHPVKAQGLTLANPHWIITLSDFGCSYFLLDNTPGFEGRDYHSGEWGAALAYQPDGGNVIAPRFLDPMFVFPDWHTLSTFVPTRGR